LKKSFLKKKTLDQQRVEWHQHIPLRLLLATLRRIISKDKTFKAFLGDLWNVNLHGFFHPMVVKNNKFSNSLRLYKNFVFSSHFFCCCYQEEFDFPRSWIKTMNVLLSCSNWFFLEKNKWHDSMQSMMKAKHWLQFWISVSAWLPFKLIYIFMSFCHPVAHFFLFKVWAFALYFYEWAFRLQIVQQTKILYFFYLQKMDGQTISEFYYLP